MGQQEQRLEHKPKGRHSSSREGGGGEAGAHKSTAQTSEERREERRAADKSVAHSLDAIALLNTRRPSILSHIWADGSQELGN
jgi:hypothetical protein